MVILGIDPGVIVAGFGVLKKGHGNPQLIDYGYLKQSSTKSLIERVGVFGEFIDAKISEHDVTHIALETPFLGKNSQSFLKLGYLRGLVYERAYRNNIILGEYAPTEVKCAVTGYGRASKEQVARMVTQLFPGMKAPELYDVTDALAVTLCGYWQTVSASRN